MINGVNLGGWMVLEPWIVPSLFYEFLGYSHESGKVAMDQYSYCEVKGPEAGNAALRAHWDAWVTEEDIAHLADKGVEAIRLPIGDWMVYPYGPFRGCTDGAAEKVDWFMDIAEKYNIKVLMDIHGIRWSQNGYDNSGQSKKITYSDDVNFTWDKVGGWMGPFDFETRQYTRIDWDHIWWSIHRAEDVLARWAHHPAFYAFEPANEPGPDSDLDVLKFYYRKTRELLLQYNKDAIFVAEDSFRSEASIWNDLFEDDDPLGDNVVIDTHKYHAWWQEPTIEEQCEAYHQAFQGLTGLKYGLWVGEWSFATDTCAHWLLGFQNNDQGNFGTCKQVECPKSHIPQELSPDLDRTEACAIPHGSCVDFCSCPQEGMCFIDSDYYSDADISYLAGCMAEVFAEHNVSASFIWTAYNQMKEDRWSYLGAHEKGWMDPFMQGRQSTQ